MDFSPGGTGLVTGCEAAVEQNKELSAAGKILLNSCPPQQSQPV